MRLNPKKAFKNKNYLERINFETTQDIIRQLIINYTQLTQFHHSKSKVVKLINQYNQVDKQKTRGHKNKTS